MKICNLRKMNTVNSGTLMKLKSDLLLSAFIIVLFLGAGMSTRAQGIYSTDTEEKKADNTESNKSGTQGGLFRDDPGPGSDVDPDPGGNDDPIGEGILILSFLSGAYALVRRNLKRKHEN